MKKTFAASALLVIVFVILYLAGILDFKNTIRKSLTEGNRLYSEERYGEALISYQNGLLKDSNNVRLNYNAAQASYVLKDYQQAAEYYGKAVEKADTYLNRGNSYFLAGESTEDINQKLQFYMNALETYKRGIFKYPANVELKFNYEFVEEKIKQLQDSMNENEQQQNNNEDNEEGKEQQNPENEQKSSHDDTSSEETGSGQEEQDTAGMSEIDDSRVGEEDSRIEQVLKMLEKQEEQALKNNRHRKKYSWRDEYDW